jgi:cell division protein FtsW
MMRNREFSALIAVTCVLLFFGLIMAYSASAAFGHENTGDDYHYFKRMIAFVILGLVMLVLGASIRYEMWTRQWSIFYGLSVLALLLVLFTPLGFGAGTTRRSLYLWFVTIQPSEFARLAVIFFLAAFCSKNAEKLKDPKKGFVPAMVGVSVISVLILSGRDLGIPVTIGLTAMCLLFIAGADILHIGATMGTAAGFFFLLIYIEPYRWQRLTVFLDPWKDPQNGGWQIIQSMAALGSGGSLGVGPGRGLQKYLYLPAAHTDFVFSIIGEEMGLLGVMIINLAFISLAIIGLRIALKADNREASFLALGISFIICITAFINMAVAADMLPTKGITLPLVSYGGSSMIANMFAIGILMNIARSSDESQMIRSIQAVDAA